MDKENNNFQYANKQIDELKSSINDIQKENIILKNESKNDKNMFETLTEKINKFETKRTKNKEQINY